MKTLLKNCKIVNHDKISQGNILISDEKIIDITDTLPQADNMIDCSGKYVLPGLIDMHVHLREPGFEYKETITSGSLAAAAGGITSLCCMANTKPCVDNASVSSFIISKAKEEGLIDVFPYGAVTKGMKGEELTEMGDLLDHGVGGFSDDGHTIMNAEVMRRGLEYAKHFGSFIATHAIDTNLQGKGVMNEGAVSAISGLYGIPTEAETTIVIRDILLAKLTRSRVHICHISAKETVDLIRWGKSQDINVTAEVTPHHFTLTDEACLTYDTNCKMSPPLRRQEDIDAIIEGLKDGTVDCIASDHAPHMADEKFVEFDLAPVGIIGLQTTLPLTLRLLDKGLIDWKDFAKILSYNPAKILGKQDIGYIGIGKLADIVVIDPSSEYIFDEKINKSKSTNTPFWGEKMKGRAIYTLKRGKIVYQA